MNVVIGLGEFRMFCLGEKEGECRAQYGDKGGNNGGNKWKGPMAAIAVMIVVSRAHPSRSPTHPGGGGRAIDRIDRPPHLRPRNHLL